eukprot:scaffold4445_cov132-Cylindrotheca_fusiformis.AAC.2
MQRSNLLLTVCSIVFGTLVLWECTRHDFSIRVETKLRGESRVLYNNYLWQRDDDDDYFDNTNNTAYFWKNQNYKKQANGGGGAYVQAGYNKTSSNSNNGGGSGGGGGDDDDSTSSSIKKQSSSFGWFGNLSPSQSAFVGILIGAMLISLIGCVLYGPALWSLFTNWLFNRKKAKEDKIAMDFANMG